MHQAWATFQPDLSVPPMTLRALLIADDTTGRMAGVIGMTMGTTITATRRVGRG